MSYQVTGKIKVLGNVEQKSDTFKVRKFVVTIDAESQYPQHIEFQAANDKCDVLNAYTVGSNVTVSFNLRGREWKNQQNEVKYFTTLDAWKVEAATASPSTSSAIPSFAHQKSKFLFPQSACVVHFYLVRSSLAFIHCSLRFLAAR